MRRCGGPEEFERAIDRRCKTACRLERPKQERSEMCFLQEAGQVGGRNVATHLAALLSQRQDLRVDRTRLFEPRAAVCAHRFTREQSQKNAARQFFGTSGIFRQSQFQASENYSDRFAALLRNFEGCANLAEPDLTKRIKQLFLAREIVEKGSFSYIGSLRDFFDGGGLKSALRDQMHRGIEKTLTDGGGGWLAGGERRSRRESVRAGGECRRAAGIERLTFIFFDWWSTLTISQ